MALGLVLLVAEGEILGGFAALSRVVGGWIRHTGPTAAIGALYAEESGVPMPITGEIFLLFAGRRISSHPEVWLITWLAFIAVVVLGSTNLYLISRTWGRSLVKGRLGRVLHITPRRLANAQRWFDRWGVWALILGRHVPGFRVPITVASGVLEVRYRVFAASVAVSTAIWAGIFLTIGIKFGRGIGGFVNVHRWLYVVVPAVLLTAFVIYVVRGLREEPVEEPVED